MRFTGAMADCPEQGQRLPETDDGLVAADLLQVCDTEPEKGVRLADTVSGVAAHQQRLVVVRGCLRVIAQPHGNAPEVT